MTSNLIKGLFREIKKWPEAVHCGLLIVGSGILMSTQLVIVRAISEDVSVFVIILFRTLFALVAISGLIVKNPKTFLYPNRPGLAILCGSLAFLASTFFYLAAKELPIADITAIHFIRPVFAALVATIVLREALNGSRIFAILTGLIGAAIIIRPGMVQINIGVIFVLGAVVVQSWNPINRKLLAKSEHPDTVAVWNVLTIFPLAAATSYFVWAIPTWEQLGVMAIIGVLEIANQRLLARAYIRGETIFVVAMHYTRLPIAAFIGFLILREFPDLWIWVGGVIIAAAATWLTLQETKPLGN